MKRSTWNSSGQRPAMISEQPVSGGFWQQTLFSTSLTSRHLPLDESQLQKSFRLSSERQLDSDWPSQSLSWQQTASVTWPSQLYRSCCDLSSTQRVSLAKLEKVQDISKMAAIFHMIVLFGTSYLPFDSMANEMKLRFDLLSQNAQVSATDLSLLNSSRLCCCWVLRTSCLSSSYFPIATFWPACHATFFSDSLSTRAAAGVV